MTRSLPGLMVLAALAACTGGDESKSAQSDRYVEVTHLAVTFEAPDDLPASEDYLAFSCRMNKEPGVFLGVGVGFCPFSADPPAEPAIYVGPYYQAGTEQGDLETPVPLPDDVGHPAGMTVQHAAGELERWVDAESTVFPDFNIVFHFLGVDDEVRAHLEDSVHASR